MTALLQQEVLKLKAEYEKGVERRKLMQAKLKEIYLKNQQKKQAQVYRNPTNFTPTTTATSKSFASPSSTTSSSGFRQNSTERSSGGLSFFNNNAPMMSNREVTS